MKIDSVTYIHSLCVVSILLLTHIPLAVFLHLIYILPLLSKLHKP